MGEEETIRIYKENCDEIISYTGTELFSQYGSMSIYQHWWFTDYASDIAEHLYDKEKCRPTFNSQSPQLYLRNVLVSLICEVAEQKGLNTTCVHLAVFILDIFMDNHNIAVERLKLVALVCLLLGAKLEDSEHKVPKMSELNTMISNQYPLKDYISVEVMIMEFFSFNISMITYSHFMEYFIFLVVSESDFELAKKNSDKYDDFKQFKFVAHETVFEIMDLCLKDIGIVHSVPSLIGSAIIYATRRVLNISPVWTTDIRNMTAYMEDEVQPCAEKIIQLREANQKKRRLNSSPESVYELVNYPEYTPKRMKISSSERAVIINPGDVQK
ncbi:cyclin-J-like [Ctenocephalides felis]|uniref:cyclin-J-like n=1 Tax=Ctenocephalides felis TaxID=7515 RepID=UPI000E6E3559|nr:cyclin-J-like [Ctenocephalides felis]